VDGPDAVVSAHKETTSTDPLPDGTVWADPFQDWRTAFDAPTGGGHNALPYQLVGAGQDKAFPVTTFTVGGVAYVWALPPNSGTTLWLDPAVYPSATSTDAIQHTQVTCDDCHVIPVGALGPHGAAVRVYIDPGYSQTEYSNPTTNAYQFEPTSTANPFGYQPVICFKCHTIDAGSVPGTRSPGGNVRHRTHWKYSRYTTTTAETWGAKCIDCHVRIPHAWRRPRLLVRTAVTTDGATPDTFPYVAPGHTGLVGIKLQNYSGLTMSPSACAQNGCFNNPTATFHPTVAQIPTTALWP
ncbi:MAG: hypothetical protein C0418_02245, partial [Coriobacteriaceae bacterium]|nr:hypothetical protein [Coriobacteriaceae bacterium]